MKARLITNRSVKLWNKGASLFDELDDEFDPNDYVRRYKQLLGVFQLWAESLVLMYSVDVSSMQLIETDKGVVKDYTISLYDLFQQLKTVDAYYKEHDPQNYLNNLRIRFDYFHLLRNALLKRKNVLHKEEKMLCDFFDKEITAINVLITQTQTPRKHEITKTKPDNKNKKPRLTTRYPNAVPENQLPKVIYKAEQKRFAARRALDFFNQNQATPPVEIIQKRSQLLCYQPLVSRILKGCGLVPGPDGDVGGDIKQLAFKTYREEKNKAPAMRLSANCMVAQNWMRGGNSRGAILFLLSCYRKLTSDNVSEKRNILLLLIRAIEKYSAQLRVQCEYLHRKTEIDKLRQENPDVNIDVIDELYRSDFEYLQSNKYHKFLPCNQPTYGEYLSALKHLELQPGQDPRFPKAYRGLRLFENRRLSLMTIQKPSDVHEYVIMYFLERCDVNTIEDMIHKILIEGDMLDFENERKNNRLN